MRFDVYDADSNGSSKEVVLLIDSERLARY